MSEFLLEKLKRYGASDFYPLHMPGHKRRIAHFGDPFAIDITEIDGFDDLHHAQGILQEAQRRAARLYGAEETYYLVNGSTCGILAAVAASVARGGRILMARNSHKSCYHAAFLNDLRVTYLYPPVYAVGSAGEDNLAATAKRSSDRYASNEGAASGICGSIRPEDVREALRRYPDIQAVLVTSPTYDGVVSDIGAIAEAVHAAGAVLIVDEAHGAHFGMHPYFPERALKCGADIVINSLHKTLPSLTQTALLHVQGARADWEKLGKYLDIYQTSSPSYVLMAGMDACVRLLEEQGGELFDAFVERLERMRSELRRKLRVLRLVDDGSEFSVAHETGQNQDQADSECAEIGGTRQSPADFGCAETGGTRQSSVDLGCAEIGRTKQSPADFERAKMLGHGLIYDFDRSKVLISTAAVSGKMISAAWSGQSGCCAAGCGMKRNAMSGPELAGILREKYHLEPEMAAADYVTAIMTVADTQEGFDRLTEALLEIDAALSEGAEYADAAKDGGTAEHADVAKDVDTSGRADAEDGASTAERIDMGESTDTSEHVDTSKSVNTEKRIDAVEIATGTQWVKYPVSEEVLTIRQAQESPAENVPLPESTGRISAEYVYLYPPGIPLLVPGERITEELLQNLEWERGAGLVLRGMADDSGKTIRVCTAQMEM